MTDSYVDDDLSEDATQQTLEDKDAQIAADHLRNHLELFPELPPSSGDGSEAANFTVTAKNLEYLARIINVFKTESERRTAMIGVRISGNRMQAAGSHRSVICRAAAPIETNPVGTPNGVLTFSFPHWQLLALGKKYEGQSLRCELNLKKASWVIKSGKKTRSELTIYPIHDPDIWSEENSSSTCDEVQFDPRDLNKGLAYIRPVARKNRHQPEYGVVVAAHGVCRGGSPAEVAVFEAPGLADVKFSAAAEDVEMVCSLLSRMQPGMTTLRQAETRQVIRDGVVTCIVERPKLQFPSIERLLTAIPTDRFLVSSKDLVDAFFRLSSVAVRDRDILIQLERGGDHGNKLNFEARSATGFGRTEIETRPPDGNIDSANGFEMNFVLASLGRAIVHGPDWVEVTMFDPKAIMMTQEHDGRRSRSYIAAHQK